MKDNRNSDESHDEEEEEDAEEAISLSDFPITANNHNNSTTYHQTGPSVPDQETDFFEFFNDDLISEISHADDIILSGKLIPTHNQQKLQHQTSIKPQRTESHRITFREDGNQRNFHKHHRRWESFSGLKSSSSPSNSPKTGLVRNRTRSLDYQNLPRSCSVKSSIGGRAADHSKVLKHRWYVLMFGSFRFPREMELRDIKNRQVRRGTTPAATMFQPLDGGGKNPVGPIHARKSSWGLLKILACKENVSNDVMPSVCCVPKV